MTTAGLIGWLATYALHSTILLCLAAFLSRVLKTDAWRELLWKSALLGGIVTATVSAVLDYTPLAGRWSTEDARSFVEVLHRPVDAPLTTDDPRQSARWSHRSVVPRAPNAEPSRVHGANWSEVLIRIWGVGAALLLARLLVGHLRLYASLRGRTWIVEGPLAEMLADLRRRAGHWRRVRLSACGACPTPIALGRGEICVPQRLLTSLDNEQQRAALAHELAHLHRRDPMWQLAAGVLEAIFFFQPLNRLGRLRLREAAENLCDDWAVLQTGSALGLARCLADVSSWVGSARVPERTLAVAEGGSPLRERIDRLIGWKARPRPGMGLRALVALALTGVVAVAAPAISADASSPDIAFGAESPSNEIPAGDVGEMMGSPDKAPRLDQEFRRTPLRVIRAALLRYHPDVRSGAFRESAVIFLVDSKGEVLRTEVGPPRLFKEFVSSPRRTAYQLHDDARPPSKTVIDSTRDLETLIASGAIPVFEVVGGGLLKEAGDVGIVFWYHFNPHP